MTIFQIFSDFVSDSNNGYIVASEGLAQQKLLNHSDYQISFMYSAQMKILFIMKNIYLVSENLSPLKTTFSSGYEKLRHCHNSPTTTTTITPTTKQPTVVGLGLINRWETTTHHLVDLANGDN